MFNRERVLSLLIVLLMVAAAAITVNESIFDHNLKRSTSAGGSTAGTENDSISLLPDGTFLIHTSGLPGTVGGYAGKVPLDIYVADDKIIDIKALPNSETPAFFNRASELLSNWIGKTIDEADALKVDAVSGATYSSEAIISNVHAGIACYQGHAVRSRIQVPLKIWIAFAVTLAACIIPLFVRNRLYHNIQMIANIIVLGFWTGQFLDYSLILKYFSYGMSIPAALTAIVMLAAAFIYPLFGKPQHYCLYICPLGSAQQLVSELCGYKIKISRKVLKSLDWFRKILWAVLMLLLWIDCLTGWMDIELFQAFQFESASWGIITAACIFVALSAVVSRPYCRFVCPTGSLFKRAENLG